MRMRRVVCLLGCGILLGAALCIQEGAALSISDSLDEAVGGSIDASTLHQKVMFGYQGWFGCPDDGSDFNQWFHWFFDNRPTAQKISFDYWPDTSELEEDELFSTRMLMERGGSFAKVFSSYTRATVVRHFEWMETYGLDGVFLQRFVSELKYRDVLSFRDHVLENVRAGAEEHGRVFSMMYDITGTATDVLVETIKEDWIYLVDELEATESSRYLHHDGLPVLGIWGLGFGHTNATPEQARELLDFFHKEAPLKYRASIVGGVPWGWRSYDAESEWATIFRSFDVICPWSVGAYTDDVSAAEFARDQIVPDLAEAKDEGVGYMPVVWPGFSWHNRHADEPLNAIPRNGGNYFWGQVFNALSAGVDMLFVAMFDEVDEGTAMFKLAPTQEMIPAQTSFVSLDADGYDLPSDWYLRLGGEAGSMLRGEIPLTPEIPIRP